MPRACGVIGRVSRPEMPVCGQFHGCGVHKIRDKFAGAVMHTRRPGWVRCGGGGGGVYRASAFPSIAGISLRCRELAVWARCRPLHCSNWRSYSITSSARSRNEAGSVNPISFAVLRLTINSYFVGSCTGRSAGFAPLRMRSTYDAPFRNGSVGLLP
jgi:hypothetical protein